MTKPKLVIFDLDLTLVSECGELYDNVHAMLKDIKAKDIRIALASYNSYGESLLARTGIRQYFDLVVCERWQSDTIDYKFTMLKKILQDTKVEPCDVVFYDDNIKNIKNGKELGITSVYITNDIYDEYKKTIVY